MSRWRRLARGVRALIRRSATERELRDEVRHYLDEATRAHLARGLSAKAARRAARLELGGEDGVTEQLRGVGWEHVVETVARDVRYAARRLRLAKGFTALAVLTLALGIGASTTIFSAVHPILFESLPYPRPDRIAAVWEVGRDGSRADATFGMYRGLVEGSRSLEAVAVYRSWQPALATADRADRLAGQRVSASYFDVLGVAPALGVGFTASDDRAGGRNVVVLGDRLWRARFGADPAIVGAVVTLDAEPYLVAGVMPRTFENVLDPAAELWAPLQYDLSQGRAWGHHLRMVARLRRGVEPDRAARELSDVGNRVLGGQRPATYGEDVRFDVVPLQDDITRAVRPALVAVLGAVALLLVMSCVNAANLLLARSARRRGELALCSALGASRRRIVAQLVTENVLLASAAGAAGLIVALVSVRVLVVLGPPELPRLDAIAVDGAVFAFAAGLTAVVGLLFGLAPALDGARGATRPLRLGSPRITGGRGRARGALVVAQVTIALVLLVSSGLLLRSLDRLFAVDAGFDPTDALTLQVHTVGPRFADDAATRQFFDDVLAAAMRVPGVREAALTSQLPISGDVDLYGVHFEPAPAADPGEVRGTFRYAVSPSYLQAMRIPVRAGRLFDELDREGAPLVAVVSESLARRRLPGLDPIGRRLRIGAADGPLFTIVGVVGDVRQLSLAVTDAEAVYVPASQWHFADRSMSLVVRAHEGAGALAPALREAVRSVDRHQPIARVATFRELLDRSAAERRFALLIVEAFALAALLLAAAGIYGVLAASVSERVREIAVRSALGASRVGILALVVRQGLLLTALGVGLGLLGASAAAHAIAAMLFAVSPLDPLTYTGVIVAMVAAALLACIVPAWRAARIDPARTLGLQ